MSRPEDLLEEARKEISQASSSESLESVRVKYLGRKGLLTGVLRDVGKLPPGDRPRAGAELNRVKIAIQALLDERKTGNDSGAAIPVPGGVDLTLPGRGRFFGQRHPLSQITAEIVSIFYSMGFGVVEGCEVEEEYYNFEALNTPDWHPSRDEHDSFYLAPGILLRTHTSPVQIRIMEKTKPPVRIVAPGRCFRRDAPDASHFTNFHQIEGLYVDRDVSFANLKGTLAEFARRVFGPEREIRFRPHYFPFTEPSAEMDVSCANCGGKGCRTCSGKGWLEILGCGMVHPNVFKYVDIDCEIYNGYAFGMGIERIAMLKYGVNDIRLFYENDIEFLSQF
ncbi:MAG: phenylalanine--tRNA ligase subunit alpha [Candidatus Eisenbacteria sp.]|nr:phenylalanine--tRNA ligase subunit alpha [Candidatus Eisenbacteria bacterium]